MRLRCLSTVASILAVAAGTAQAQPTISDIAICNEEAHAQTAAPSASPETLGPGLRPEAVQKLPRSTTGETTDPSGSIITGTPDPLAMGMAADRAGDVAYRTAYRACLQRRTERRR